MESPRESPHELLDDLDRRIVSVVREAATPLGAKDIGDELRAEGDAVSHATLLRRLEKLIEQNRIQRTGQARATRYSLDPMADYFAVPPTKRPRVSYNFAALEAYEPNVTRWLTDAEIDALTMAGGGRRLDASTYAGAIAQKLLVDLSFASSALEGNTYTYLDTEVLIQFGQEAEGKDRDETVMILNHKEAITYLVENIDDIVVAPREVKTFHALLSRNLSNMGPRDVGSIRRIPIDHIGGSAYLPLAIPQMIEEELEKICAKASKINEPFEQSLFLMTFISYLQAFRDVNKRTARLMCNVPLLKFGLAPMSFIEMDKSAYVRGLLSFYELNRVDIVKSAFVDAYVKSAARYDAYIGRSKEILDIELKRRADIFSCTRDYVREVAEGKIAANADVYARERFKEEPDATRDLIVDRVVEVVDSLEEGNHIAYGISRDCFAAYQSALADSARPR